MKPVRDKTVQVLKDKFDKLGEVETDTNKREIREARHRIKSTIHKRVRNNGKRQLREQLEGKTDE
jgi:hypothetical protein